MTYAAPLVVHCPHCDQKLSQTRLGSGNTFGARYWTDGKREAPMLPDIPDLVRCPHCDDLLYISEARESTDERSAPRGIDPKLADWLQAIDRHLWTDEDGEKYLRFSAWRAANDAWRPYGDNDAKSAPASFTEQDESNVRELSALLETDEDPDVTFVRAEIFRELGDFENAINLLKSLTGEQYATVQKFMLGLAEKGIREVHELKFD